MQLNKRRILLTMGLLLVVGGWGTTQYAEARQQGLSNRTRDKAWKGQAGFMSGPMIYTGGILLMAAGVVTVVFTKD